MNTKFFTLFFASLLIISSLTSAAVLFDKVSGNSSTIAPGSSYVLQFALNNTVSDHKINDITLTLPSQFDSGVWSEAKIGSVPLTIESNQIRMGSSIVIPENSLSDLISIKFTANTLSTPGLKTGAVLLSAKNVDNGVSVAVNQNGLPLKLIIQEKPTFTLTKVRELTKTQSGIVNITNTGNVILSPLALSSNSGLTNVQFSKNNFQLTIGASELVEVTAENIAALKFGSYSTTVTANSSNAQSSVTFNPIRQSFCNNGSFGDLRITSLDIESSGDDDETWMRLDEVSIEVDVENIGTNDIDNVEIVMDLFDSNGKSLVKDLDFSNSDDKSYNLGKIKDGDTETATFKFKVPVDFDEGDYKMAFKAYSKKSSESAICTDYSDDFDNTIYQSIQVDSEEDEGKYIIFDNIQFNPTEATCGDQVTMTFDVANVGSDTEDQTKVNIISKELGIDASSVITSDLDAGEKQSISLSFMVPKNIVDKIYPINLNADYDYSNSNYREHSDKDTQTTLRVFGCSVSNTVQNPISIMGASLDSDAVAGKPMVVRATIKNVADQSALFTVGAKGYSSWAELSEISDESFTLNAGETKDVELTFDLNADATGEKTFVLEVKSNGLTKTTEVVASIESTQSTGSGLTSMFSSSSNSGLIWVIGLVNLVLIILIIVVAVKVSRR